MLSEAGAEGQILPSSTFCSIQTLSGWMSPPAWGGTRPRRPTRTGEGPVLLRPPVPLLSSPETPSHRPRNCLTWAPVASRVDAQNHPSPSCVFAKLSWVPAGSPPRIHHHVVIPASSPCSTVTSHASSRARPCRGPHRSSPGWT